MVVKCVVWLATAAPDSLVPPLMAIAICVLAGSGACGMIVVRVKSGEKLMLDGTSVTEPPLNWMELPVTDTGLMALLKVTLTTAFVPMFVDAFGGPPVEMVGLTLSTAVPAVKGRQ